MDTKDLKSFIKVYEYRSINLAAKYLYITPQGLSRVIQKLERELNVSLFVRSTNGMEPTKAGDNLYDRSKPIIRQLNGIVSELHVSSDPVLKVPCTCGFMRSITIKLAQDFRSEYPDIKLQLYEQTDTTILRLLLDGDVELAVLSGPVDLTRLSYCIFQIVYQFLECFMLIDYEWTKHKVNRGGNIYEKQVRNPINQVKRQVYILARFLKYSGIRVWVEGYVLLLNNNSPVHNDMVLESFEGIDQALHGRTHNSLNSGAVAAIKELLQ